MNFARSRKHHTRLPRNCEAIEKATDRGAPPGVLIGYANKAEIEQEEGMYRKGVDRPVPLPVQALDHATGYLMASAVLRAMHLRNTTGQIKSARLSLARTAALLTSAGSHEFRGQEVVETSNDRAPSTERTDWGPAQRLRFPVQMDGVGPKWQYPAGLLRTDEARW